MCSTAGVLLLNRDSALALFFALVAPVASLRCRDLVTGDCRILFSGRMGVTNGPGVARFGLGQRVLFRSDLEAVRCLVSAFPVPHAYRAHQPVTRMRRSPWLVAGPSRMRDIPSRVHLP